LLLSATEAQRTDLTALAGSRDRGEADRAYAVLLTLAGWTSARSEGRGFLIEIDFARVPPGNQVSIPRHSPDRALSAAADQRQAVLQ
jgi:hypothetical protein